MNLKPVLFAMLFAGLTSAQTTAAENPEYSRWTFGGSAGLGGTFGSGGSTSVYLSPRVGYRLSPEVETGLAGSFWWSGSSQYSWRTFGVGPYINYMPWQNFYLSAMFQEYFYTENFKTLPLKQSGEEAALYFGGGYRQRVGQNAWLQIGAMYNVLYDKGKSIFGSGFVPSAGVVFGL